MCQPDQSQLTRRARILEMLNKCTRIRSCTGSHYECHDRTCPGQMCPQTGLIGAYSAKCGVFRSLAFGKYFQKVSLKS